MSRRRLWAVTIVMCGLSAAFDAAAADPTKAQCIAANEDAQTQRQQGRLQAARARLTVCIAKSCPGPVREDCEERLAEVDRAIPTVVFTARDEEGNDLSAVMVTMDGAVLAESLPGSAIAIEPGEHTFELTTAGFPPQSRRLVVREGVKGRQEEIRFTRGAKIQTARSSRLVVSAASAATVTIDGTVVGSGHVERELSPGSHEVGVNQPGKTPYKGHVELREAETRTLQATLEDERPRSLLPWLIGGAVVLVAGAAVGGYFLFRPEDRTEAPPAGSLGGVRFSAFGALGH